MHPEMRSASGKVTVNMRHRIKAGLFVVLISALAAVGHVSASGSGSCIGEAVVLNIPNIPDFQRDLAVFTDTVECTGDTMGGIPKAFSIVNEKAPPGTPGTRFEGEPRDFESLQPGTRFCFTWRIAHGLGPDGLISSSALSVEKPECDL